MKTQSQKILDYMLKGNSITPIYALKKFGCFRLSARIWDIRERSGLPVITKYVTKEGKTFASYTVQEDYRPL